VIAMTNAPTQTGIYEDFLTGSVMGQGFRMGTSNCRSQFSRQTCCRRRDGSRALAKQFNINAEGDLVDHEEACLTVEPGIAPQHLRRTCAGL
jgi:hypothetical protein